MIYNILIGGIQGDGLASLGQILLRVFGRLGYHTQSERSFSSRIKGGHTNTRITVSDEPVHSVHRPYHLIIALDEKTLTAYREDTDEGAMILTTLMNTDHPAIDLKAYTTEERYHNILLLGWVAAYLGLPRQTLVHFIKERFARKGDEVVGKNIELFVEAYEKAPRGQGPTFVDREKALVALTGNELFAMGALVSGCRFHAAYPITPASEILEYMAKVLPTYGGVFVQTEDEIAAATMALGAAFAGTPAMTTTSGPGLSLMQETLGLAMMTETPLVIVDVQRVGPSTGLPTKPEQSDLWAALFGSHGDGSPIVLCPYDARTLLTSAGDAFHLAGSYRHPVVVLSDLTLGLSITTVPIEEVTIPKAVPRSPRLGADGTIATTGLEHDETGHVNNNPEVRRKGADHRHDKLNPLSRIKGIDTFGRQDADTVILATGSLYGLLRDYFATDHAIAMITRLHPLDTASLAALDSAYEQVIVIDLNRDAQLFRLLTLHFSEASLRSFIAYDGEMPTPEEIGGFIDGNV